LEVVSEDEENPKVVVVDPPLVVKEIANPTNYAMKDLSTKQLHLGKNIPK